MNKEGKNKNINKNISKIKSIFDENSFEMDIHNILYFFCVFTGKNLLKVLDLF